LRAFIDRCEARLALSRGAAGGAAGPSAPAAPASKGDPKKKKK
jgi:hypothetical protein